MRRHLQEARGRLGDAHYAAQDAAMEHLHGRVSQAAIDAGQDPRSIVVDRSGPKHFVGVDSSPEGDTLAAHEWGTLDDAPHATLRNESRRAEKESDAIYGQHLQAGLGL